jgi:hypothetical protein
MSDLECKFCRNTACILYGVCNECYENILKTDINENSFFILSDTGSTPGSTGTGVGTGKFGEQSSAYSDDFFEMNDFEKVYFKYASSIHKYFKIILCGKYIRISQN